MVIALADIQFFLSTTSGAAGNSLAQANQNLSLGKYVSTSQLATALNALFDDISGAENAALIVEYRSLFVKNVNPLTASSLSLFLQSEVAGGASIALGVDPTAASDQGAAAAQGLSIANDTTAPAGVTFSAPTTDAAGVLVGDLAQNQVRQIWIRRTATNSTAINGDGGTLGVGFDSPA